MSLVRLIDNWNSYLQFLKSVPQQQINAELRLTGKLNNLFQGVFAGILDEVNNYNRLPNRDELAPVVNNYFNNIKEPYIEILQEEAVEIGQYGRNRIIHHLQASNVSIDYSDLSDNIVQLLNNNIFVASQQTLERMTGDVMSVIGEGVSDGLGIREVAEMLDSKFTGMQDYELRRIARTEINNYSNLSAVETEKEFGVEYHQWITGDDDRVRGTNPNDEADHTILHLQIVRIGDTFENGLLYPGDKSGELNQIINCRCRVVPFIMPHNKMAPINERYFFEEDLIAI